MRDKVWRDTCSAVHDPEGRIDATFNPTTGAWTDTSPATVYEGICGVSTVNREDAAVVEIDRMQLQAEYVLKVPLDADVPAGSVVTILTSERNEQLVGKVLVTGMAMSGTLSIGQRIPMVRRETIARDVVAPA